MDFEEKINEIDKKTSGDVKKDLHFKSLRNFIYHYKSIKKEKVKITKLLEEYIKLIEAKEYSFTEEESKAAFSLFIQTLGIRYYRKYLNFSNYLSIELAVLFFTIPNLVVWFIFYSNIIRFFFLLLSVLYWINYSIKFSKKKIFGYRY